MACCNLALALCFIFGLPCSWSLRANKGSDEVNGGRSLRQTTKERPVMASMGNKFEVSAHEDSKSGVYFWILGADVYNTGRRDWGDSEINKETTHSVYFHTEEVLARVGAYSNLASSRKYYAGYPNQPSSWKYFWALHCVRYDNGEIELAVIPNDLRYIWANSLIETLRGPSRSHSLRSWGSSPTHRTDEDIWVALLVEPQTHVKRLYDKAKAAKVSKCSRFKSWRDHAMCGQQAPENSCSKVVLNNTQDKKLECPKFYKTTAKGKYTANGMLECQAVQCVPAGYHDGFSVSCKSSTYGPFCYPKACAGMPDTADALRLKEWRASHGMEEKKDVDGGKEKKEGDSRTLASPYTWRLKEWMATHGMEEKKDVDGGKENKEDDSRTLGTLEDTLRLKEWRTTHGMEEKKEVDPCDSSIDGSSFWILGGDEYNEIDGGWYDSDRGPGTHSVVFQEAQAQAHTGQERNDATKDFLFWALRCIRLRDGSFEAVDQGSMRTSKWRSGINVWRIRARRSYDAIWKALLIDDPQKYVKMSYEEAKAKVAAKAGPTAAQKAQVEARKNTD